MATSWPLYPASFRPLRNAARGRANPLRDPLLRNPTTGVDRLCLWSAIVDSSPPRPSEALRALSVDASAVHPHSWLIKTAPTIVYFPRLALPGRLDVALGAPLAAPFAKKPQPQPQICTSFGFQQGWSLFGY